MSCWLSWHAILRQTWNEGKTYVLITIMLITKKKGDVRCGRILAHLLRNKMWPNAQPHSALSQQRVMGGITIICPRSTNDPPTSQCTSIIPEVNPKKTRPGKNVVDLRCFNGKEIAARSWGSWIPLYQKWMRCLSPEQHRISAHASKASPWIQWPTV